MNISPYGEITAAKWLSLVISIKSRKDYVVLISINIIKGVMEQYTKKKIDKERLQLVIYGMEFVLFFVLFYLTPMVCDRWMEKDVQTGFETFVNYLVYQNTWFWGANGRIFSNIYSYFVDWNVLIRAGINAFSLVLSSYIVNKCVGKKGSADSSSRETLIACILPFLVSSGIYTQVYFYATTLYISTILIFCSIFWFFEKEIYRFLHRRGNIISCIGIFVCSMWLENLSLCIVIYLFIYCIRNWWVHRKISGYLILNLFASISGLLLMFCSSRFASSGRLKQDYDFSLTLISRNLLEFLSGNAVIILIFSISVLLFVKCHSVNRMEKLIICSWWGGVSLLEVFYIIFQVYTMISTELNRKDYYGEIYSWHSYSNAYFVTMFSWINEVMLMLVIPIYIISIAFIIYGVQKWSNKKGMMYAIFSALFVALVIPIFGLNPPGARLYHLPILLIIILTTYFYANIDRKSPKPKIILFLMFFIIYINNLAFISASYSIDRERTRIAEFVRVRQATSDWDYTNDIVYMPAYEIDTAGKVLGASEEGANPSREHIYYKVLLRHYGLGSETKIVFVKPE